jgi:hypothetical protein
MLEAADGLTGLVLSSRFSVLRKNVPALTENRELATEN